MSERTIRFIEKPSLSIIGDILTKRFKKRVSIKAVDDGLEFTFETDPTPGDLVRLETMMERWGYLLE